MATTFRGGTQEGGGHRSHEADVIVRAGVVQEPGTQLIPRAGIGTHAPEATSPALSKGQAPPSLLRLLQHPCLMEAQVAGARGANGRAWEMNRSY